VLTSNQHYCFLLPTAYESTGGYCMGLRDFLYRNFWWVKLEVQFLFWSVVLVWNRVCKNGNCARSESQSWLLTWVTKSTFSFLQSWCCSERLCWLYFCPSPYHHTANSLQGQNPFPCIIWSTFLFLIVSDKVAVGRLLPKYV